MSSICLPLPPTTRCDAWAGALINIDQLQETYSGNLHSSSSTNSSTLFTNLDFYDGLLSSYKMYKYRRSGQTFLSKIQTLLETSGLDDKTNGENYSTILDSTRYLQTFFCANDVFGWNDETKSVKYTECGDSSATSITANSHPRKLCPSMCLDAQNSLVASLTTFVKKYGIASSGTSIKDITDSFSTVCTALSSNGDVRGEGECVKQIKSESQTCGKENFSK